MSDIIFDLDLETEKDNGTYKAEPAKGDLEFKNVSFAYEGKEEKALNNISFYVPAGKTVALVGAFRFGQIDYCQFSNAFLRYR